MPDIKETTIIRLLEAGDERCMKMMFDTYYQALCTCYALFDFDGRCGGYCSDGVYILVE